MLPAPVARRFCIKAWIAAKPSSACSWSMGPGWISKTPVDERRSISRSVCRLQLRRQFRLRLRQVARQDAALAGAPEAPVHPVLRLLLQSTLQPSRSCAGRPGADMLFIAQFEDKPGVAELRQKLLEDHFAFLDRSKDKVLVAGSVREIPSDLPLGGLWIIEAENEAEVREIFKDDPFWVNGLRASVRINRWAKAFPDRKTPV